MDCRQSSLGEYCRHLADKCRGLKQVVFESPACLSALSLQDLCKIPFWHLLLPVVEDAVEEIHRSKRYAALSAELRRDFESSLLKRIAGISQYSLFFEFSLFRAARTSGMVALLTASRAPGSSLYLSFVSKMLEPKTYLAFLEQYSELARCLRVLSRNWIESVDELLARLENDAEIISSEFFDGAALGDLEKVNLTLSDPHHHGRTVVALQFSNGKSLFYKPRDCSSDLNYARIVEWMQVRGASVKAPLVLNRNGYGWTLAVPKHPCLNLEEVAKFYRNTGVLLCLLYALRGTDNHCENIIASGDMPVMIDAETLLHPEPDELIPGLELPEGNDRDTIFSTMMLPVEKIEQSKDKLAMPDLSALGCVGLNQLKPPFALPELLRVNTDSMNLELNSDLSGAIQLNSQVLLDGEIQDFLDFRSEILEGFSEMYRLLLCHKNELLAEDSPVSYFKKQKVRSIPRSTMTYSCLLRLSCNSLYMRDASKREQYLREMLASIIPKCTPEIMPFIDREVASMLKDLDVPYFHIEAADQQPESWMELKGSCYDAVVARISSLSQENLEKHLKDIEKCWSRSDR